jgi:tetratricopeptide (TPR) repeat protein
MRHADSLEEAERILSSHTPIGCWTYLVTDGKRREVLCWEENPDRQVATRVPQSDASFSYTNIYIDPELGRTELDVYGSYWRHNQGRWQRARARLAEGHGALDPTAMAGILADLGSGQCRFRDAARMLLTVGSVVFRPEDGAFWVSTGEAPVSQNPFVPFSLTTESSAPEHGTLTDHAERDPAGLAAFTAYRKAYTAYLDEQDLDGARRHMADALAHQPDQALYQCIAGLLALKAGDLSPAFEAFDRAVTIGHVDPERVAAFHVWRGRAADLGGRRDAAVADYRAALDRPADAPMKRAAEKGLKTAYSRRRARRFNIDFTFADVMAP